MRHRSTCAGRHRARFAVLGLAAAVLLLLPSGQARAESAQDVARVSYTQGTARMMRGDQPEFEQVVVNMPVFSGARLETGSDGQVEVEFGDGSVARLTPNSSLQLDQIGRDQVQMEQVSGLGYYELNAGPDHPEFVLRFAANRITPASNTIFRVNLDNNPEAAVITGDVHVESGSGTASDVGENQTARFGRDDAGNYLVAQGVLADSWDQWNQDRDQQIAREAAQQTTARNDSANPEDQNWNDLDYYGNWYATPDDGEVWVPSGVGSGFDPYGNGYWGYYGGIGYTWISGYPWGWLPYHCGGWNYYDGFGWGWSPGNCGQAWLPVGGVGLCPAGYRIPARPILRNPRAHPILDQRLVRVNRGVVRTPAGGPGVGTRPQPVTPHNRALQFGGEPIHPLPRTNVASNSLVSAAGSAAGTSPGARAVLSGVYPRTGGRAEYQRATSGGELREGETAAPPRPGYNGSSVGNGFVGQRPAPEIGHPVGIPRIDQMPRPGIDQPMVQRPAIERGPVYMPRPTPEIRAAPGPAATPRAAPPAAATPAPHSGPAPAGPHGRG